MTDHPITLVRATTTPALAYAALEAWRCCYGNDILALCQIDAALRAGRDVDLDEIGEGYMLARRLWRVTQDYLEGEYCTRYCFEPDAAEIDRESGVLAHRTCTGATLGLARDTGEITIRRTTPFEADDHRARFFVALQAALEGDAVAATTVFEAVQGRDHSRRAEAYGWRAAWESAHPDAGGINIARSPREVAR